MDVRKEGVDRYLIGSAGRITQSARWVDGAEAADQVSRVAGDFRRKVYAVFDNAVVSGGGSCVLISFKKGKYTMVWKELGSRDEGWEGGGGGGGGGGGWKDDRDPLFHDALPIGVPERRHSHEKLVQYDTKGPPVDSGGMSCSDAQRSEHTVAYVEEQAEYVSRSPSFVRTSGAM